MSIHQPSRLLPLHTLLTAGLATLLWTGCASSLPGADTAAQPLYQQLGGIENIKAFTGRTLTRVAADPQAGRTFKGIKMPPLIDSVSAYICRAADGPCAYEGQDMKKSHAELGITGSDFDLLVEILREEMNAAGVSNGAKNELLRRLAPTRRDMVVR